MELAFSFPKQKLGLFMIIAGIALTLILIFVKINYDQQAAFLCENIEAAGGNMLTCPVHKTDVSWFFMAGFGILFAMIVGGVYLAFLDPSNKIENETMEKPKTALVPMDTSKMDPESKLIYDLLFQHEGGLFQSQIVKETNFSKVKISRILDKLEHENVIERKRRGMANIVVLR